MRARTLLPFFLLSGFCGLVYQVVWLRLAMSAFGVTAPLVSTVVAVFMAGLGIGSWAAGRLAERIEGKHAISPLHVYAAAELFVASSLAAVPWALRLGRDLLAAAGGGVTWGSFAHHLAAGGWISLSLAPFCVAMGMTIPLGIWAIRRAAPREAGAGFGQLYLANTVGACLGALLAAFVVIELAGFGGTLVLAASVNVLLAAFAVLLARRSAGGEESSAAFECAAASSTCDGGIPESTAAPSPSRAIAAFLFLSGFSSMGMEVAWVRLFTPWLGTFVYAFALIVAIYLLATLVGSWVYTRARRPWSRQKVEPRAPWLAGAAALFSLVPLVLADPRLSWWDGLGGGGSRVLVSVSPFCAALGFLTPALVERWSGGDPRRTGSVYALNALGCVLGPLIAGFMLLPFCGERWTIVLMALPLLFAAPSLTEELGPRSARGVAAGLAVIGAVAAVVFLTADPYAEQPGVEVRRDATATVVAHGEGMSRQLLVNGVGMTQLTPITKLMAHLPLALLDHRPQSGLVICFGMGTSFRSMHSWGIRVTAVELVPSVPELFGFFHDDAAELRRSPRGRIVIDDGRRFLERTAERFDVITVDPPPPVSAAGSSLLYSREFYQVARRRLAPGGIVQQWIPGGDAVDLAAFAAAFAEAFPHTVALTSVEGWGVHLLGSDRPLVLPPPTVLAARLPAKAASDLVEWGPAANPVAQLALALGRPHHLSELEGLAPAVGPLTDDSPVNEYFLLRALRAARGR